ncbi:DUF1963 domain-containing protein [Spirosoma sp. HMF3257]|uniref:DUF1963 domain-containing protein n=1 Tax=Spirosoma telluris TaxID=2183553 RepID=A0A327NF38_9BACT|nr:DUF1963 domain-containing protein [Spirosoma telluris]RAI73383.1 hypothetical protein HMF3257_01135 [Spirosoma telluris]
MTKKEFSDQIVRRAIRMKVGGFRPVDNPQASWIGKVLVAKPDEGWPQREGKPMLPLCQINLNDFAFKPELVSDIALITIFIDSNEIPREDDENGTSWCLRAYNTPGELTPLAQVPVLSPIKPMQMIPEVVEQDFPNWDDCPIPIPARYDENYSEIFPNTAGIKFGGWPTLIQGEISWDSAAEFAFQLDSIPKARWQWGDNGVAYFGRNKEEVGSAQWTFAWQSY